MSTEPRVLLLPGWQNSGPGHWQTLWEAEEPSFRRFAPADWDHPDLADWQAALEASLALAERPAVLVAHSLACLLVAHAADHVAGRVLGAFLVAVPDPDGALFPVEAASFRDVPSRPLISRYLDIKGRGS